MNENSYVGDKNIIQSTLSQPYTAFFDSAGSIRPRKEFTNCDLEEVWTYKMGGYSIPYTKDLPYGKFMRQIILEMIDNGRLARLKAKWKVKNPDCEPLLKTGQALSFENLVTLFLLIYVGCFSAFCISILENIHHKVYPQTSTSEGEEYIAKMRTSIAKIKIYMHNTKEISDYQKIILKEFLKVVELDLLDYRNKSS